MMKTLSTLLVLCAPVLFVLPSFEMFGIAEAKAQRISKSECDQVAKIGATNSAGNSPFGPYVQSVFCVKRGARLALTYVIRFQNSFSGLTQGEKKARQQQLTNAWCTTPSQKTLLAEVDIHYLWYEGRGLSLGDAYIKIEDC